MKRAPSALEMTLEIFMRSDGIPYEKEYRFAAEHVGGTGKGVRRRLEQAHMKDWRFDFVITDQKVAIECEGGIYTGGAHVRGKYYEDNCAKYNTALVLGWKVIRVTKRQIDSGQAMAWIHGAIGDKGPQGALFG